ncbi:alpha/beta hydrolase, partial [Streptomyces sp. NPDC096080]
MAHQATPVRRARLGRAFGPEPTAVSGAVLLLPGGDEESARRPSPLAAAAVRSLGRGLARAGRADGLAVHVVRYACRGWNGGAGQRPQDPAGGPPQMGRREGAR